MCGDSWYGNLQRNGKSARDFLGIPPVPTARFFQTIVSQNSHPNIPLHHCSKNGSPDTIPHIYLCFRFAFSLGLRFPFFPVSSRFAFSASPCFALSNNSRH